MRALALFLAALFLAAPALAAPAARRPAGTDWTKTVTQTPLGSFVLGNPKAPRVIEYVSYTCPHCAHFVIEASEPLRANWVKRGAISVELRNAVRDPYDLAAAVMARCGGPARFFADHEALFANYDDWMAKLQEYDAARASRPAPTGVAAQLADIAATTGLSDLMAKRGLPLARQKACFANKADLDRIVAMRKEAWEDRKIGGTPAFVFDGKLLDAHDWDGLRAALPASPK